MAGAPLADRLRAEINEHGPIPVSRFVAVALYDADEGFYATTGRAGRRGDFITAPEVGPLFGAVLSRAVDRWWEEAGRPARFTVVEHGAGPGTLGRTVTAAAGAALTAGALRWVMIEPSATQRAVHPEGPHLASVEPGAAELGHVDLVVANELLDNLPFDVVARRAAGWVSLQVDLSEQGFLLTDGPHAASPAGPIDAVPVDTVLPVAGAAVEWIRAQRELHPGARLLVLDYMAGVDDLVARDGEWLRAYRDHERVAEWLAAPGSADVTIDVPLDQLVPLEPTTISTQAEFLRRHGIDELVEEGRAAWHEGASVGDLAALKARSRIREAEALLDPAGLGSFTVLEWTPVVRD